MQYLSISQAKRKAATFLERHHPSGSIPIPIEWIVEKSLKLEIIPVPLLRSTYGMDGSISVDLKSITVDQELMEDIPNRYRFTLAHEVAHLELHSALIRGWRINSVEELRAKMASLSPEIYRSLEWQANCLAGYLLVPAPSLIAEFAQLHIGESELEIAEAVQNLSQVFEVSSKVIEIRLEKEGLLPHEAVTVL